MLPKLEVLDCRGVALGAESINGIAQSQSIQYLNVAGCGLKVQEIEQFLKMRQLKVIVVSEYFEYTRSREVDIDNAVGTDDSLSESLESRRGEFPLVTIITTKDWYKFRGVTGDFPVRNNWHRVRWQYNDPDLPDDRN